MKPEIAVAVAVGFAAVMLAGCLGTGDTLDADESRAAVGSDWERQAHAVVALVDTGINPYHVTFRDDSPEAFVHPSDYIDGYSEDAVALNLTFAAKDYWSAVKADCEAVWSQLEAGQLYWFPGTKIVGGVFLHDARTVDCSAEEPGAAGLLDQGGHGTMVASRAASFEYGACPGCKVVAIEGFSTESTVWGGENAAWIDAQSNSWGPFLPLWSPVAEVPILAGSNPEFVAAVEKAAQQHLSFWASGNGALTRLGVLGHPTVVDPRMTPSIVMVGGHDSGQVNTWPDWPPHVVSDSCNSWAADHRSLDHSAEDIGGGTSGASPFAAGMGVRVLLEARTLLDDTVEGVRDGVVASGTPPAGVTEGPLADGVFTLDEWKELVFKTATERPERQYEDGSICDAVGGLVLYSATPIAWQDVPESYPEYVHIGYGAVDNESRDLAFQVLRGEAPLPDRAETDAYFARDAQVRGTLHDVYSG